MSFYWFKTGFVPFTRVVEQAEMFLFDAFNWAYAGAMFVTTPRAPLAL